MRRERCRAAMLDAASARCRATLIFRWRYYSVEHMPSRLFHDDAPFRQRAVGDVFEPQRRRCHAPADDEAASERLLTARLSLR